MPAVLAGVWFRTGWRFTPGLHVFGMMLHGAAGGAALLLGLGIWYVACLRRRDRLGVDGKQLLVLAVFYFLGALMLFPLAMGGGFVAGRRLAYAAADTARLRKACETVACRHGRAGCGELVEMGEAEGDHA